jgi:hypothetical protein
MNNLLDSQAELIREQAWLDARATIVSELVRLGVIATHNDVAGFWDHTQTHPTWVSIYDVIESARD